jgi:hypothetical protein
LDRRNYAVVVAAGIAVFALSWWYAGARKYVSSLLEENVLLTFE